MYKVFNNTQKILILKKDTDLEYGDAITICIRDIQKLPQIIDNHVFSSNSLDLILLSEEPDELIFAFENLFKIHLAAGGWVYNKSRLLMIKRSGKWDIPKGHWEKGETMEETAIREVEEETGVGKLSIEKYLGYSQHIYFHKDKAILKKTEWYRMKSTYKGELTPQTAEGITKAKWVKPANVEDKLQKGWLSLYDFYLENLFRYAH